MNMNIKWCLLSYSLHERWFRNKVKLYSEKFLTSMTSYFNHNQWLFILMAFFISYYFLFFLNIRIQYDVFIWFSSNFWNFRDTQKRKIGMKDSPTHKNVLKLIFPPLPTPSLLLYLSTAANNNVMYKGIGNNSRRFEFR